ncbi:MAG: LPS-assembly protein LptD [Alphaproteobacteria bacterium]|nr:MAG: LPS-assembly protein LptD [Alphaproteobacteria bacterium]
MAAILLLPAALMAGLAPARAQSTVSPLSTVPATGLQKTQPGQPMLLQADEMIYDNQNNRVVAVGNVEIYYGTYTLIADKVTYDRRSNTLYAEGNVHIKEPDGAVIKADRIRLTDDFRDGFISSLKIVTQDDARIAAARATRAEGETTIFEDAAFTPCKPCKDHPEKPPTWQIKAQKVIHKKSEATITYKNALFEFFGVPVAWIPYFKHADPSVKRKSGFLIPSVSNSDELGFSVETPYYFALAPNYDFTFSPMYTEKHGVVWKGKWRHRTVNGRYSIELAGLDFTQSDDFVRGDDKFRGSIKTKGNFALNQYWEWGWDITADTDKTFRRFFKLDNILTSDRISQVYLTGQRGRNYFSARAYNFDGLRSVDRSDTETWIHPVVDYNYIFSQPVLGGELAFDTHTMSITRDDGQESTRLIAQMKWRRSFIDRRGQVFTPFAMARGDYYHVNGTVDPDPLTGTTAPDGDVVRGVALGGVEYRYPFVKHTAKASHVFEPIAQVIARPGIEDQPKIPNEDSRSLVFDDTLLFDINKFSGFDRVEGGSRANVGVRYTMQRSDGGYMQAVFGQSYELGGSNEFLADTGLGTRASDYVAGLYIQPMRYFSFTGQGRFDEDTFELQRTDLTAQAYYGGVSGYVTYANLQAQPSLGVTKDREEVVGSTTLQLTQNWSVLGSLRFDIEGDQRISDSVGLKYHDDCFALTVTYSESFIRDQDIEPEERVMLRFELKHLGAFDVDATPPEG